eukprot:CAMPEP_0196724066 /NCGR_PEP_ID=MMETSP1091-20130531/6083_1 /TAXON_ID=302021 /ORGANISM="Rhodomonas sp., Strain CCMP768" /LENGTH=227 /DNA_ID=CAMNT_0042066157 /DNA_START=48 /DNA_END=731 /DNA_ORIENTATION=-
MPTALSMEEEASSPAMTAHRLSSANSTWRAVDAKADRSAVALQLAAKILASRKEALSYDQRTELLRLSNRAELSTAKLTLRLCDILLNKGGAGNDDDKEDEDEVLESDDQEFDLDATAGDAQGSDTVSVENEGAPPSGVGHGGTLAVVVVAAAAWIALQRRQDWRSRLQALVPAAVAAGTDGFEWFWEGLCEGARSRFFEGLFCLVVAQIACRLPKRGAALLEWMLE